MVSGKGNKIEIAYGAYQINPKGICRVECKSNSIELITNNILYYIAKPQSQLM